MLLSVFTSYAAIMRQYILYKNYKNVNSPGTGEIFSPKRKNEVKAIAEILGYEIEFKKLNKYSP